MAPPTPNRPLPQGMTEQRLYNYLRRSMSMNINRTLLFNAHNWIVTNQMSVSDPKLHDILAQYFATIPSAAVAAYHTRRATQLRNRSHQDATTSRVAAQQPHQPRTDNQASVPSPTDAGSSDVRNVSSQNLLKRARSRSQFSTQRQQASAAEAAAKRRRMETEVQPRIQKEIHHPLHVHDSQPCDATNYMPSLQRAIRALEEECVQNDAAATTVHYNYTIDEDVKRMQVSIRVKADVPKLAQSATDGIATSSSYCRFGSADDIKPGGTIYVKARNRAARLARFKIDDIRVKIETACRKELRVYVQRLLHSWRSPDLKTNCFRAFHNAKEMLLREGKGNLYGASVSLYGSLTTGLVLGESDIDVSVKIPALFRSSRNEDAHLIKAKTVEVLKYVANQLKKERMESVFVVTQARVPVLRYMDRETQVHVDVTLNNDRSLLQSRLLRRHMQKDARIWEMCMIVKYWAKQRRLCGVAAGHINSMGWVIMVIFFTQHLIHPRIGGLFRAKRPHSNFSTIVEEPWRYNSWRNGHNRSATHALLVEFFRVFGFEFDFAHEAISIALQRRDSASNVCAAGGGGDRTLFIEQPLIAGSNVVHYVSYASLQVVRNEMQRAYELLQSTQQPVHELFAVRQSRAAVDSLFARH